VGRKKSGERQTGGADIINRVEWNCTTAGERGYIDKIIDLLLQQNNIYEGGTSIKNDGRMAHREWKEARRCLGCREICASSHGD
jgi:LmbE family N-acetylglucosaminyl deacetylase